MYWLSRQERVGVVKDWSYTLKLVSCLWPAVGPWRVFAWGFAHWI